MDRLSKIASWVGRTLGVKKKFFDIPTISGGFEIFRGLSWDETSWSQGKQLNVYAKSLYVFRCVSKIAQKTASIDWNLFRIKNRAGDQVEVFVHDALDLLYRPNPFQTKGEFFELFMINKLLAGEAFILKVRENGPGSKVRELWNLRPDYVTIIKDPEKFVKGFEFNKEGGSVTFSPEDIIWDKYPNPLDQYGGISALFSSQTRVETEYNATAYQKNFFKNNARPDFLLLTDDKIGESQKEEIDQKWNKRLRGKDNSGKGVVLEGGLKYQQVSISQREMDFIESLRMTRDDILTAFAVPKPIVAITDDVNLANAKTAMEIFLAETIQPEIKRLTEKLNEHLIYPEYGDLFLIDYDTSFLPTDERQRAEIQNIQVANGTMLINEAREELGLPPIKGGWTLRAPLGMVAVGGLSENQPAKQLGVPKERIFRGRQKAVEFLTLKEEIKDLLLEGVAMELGAKPKKKTKGAPKFKSIIPKEIRGTYYETINKQIDEKGKAFEPALKEFAREQKERVLSELGSGKSFTVDHAKALDGMFDKAKENKLLSELSIPFIEEFLKTAGEEAMETVNPAEEFEITDRIMKYIKDRAKELAKAVNSTTVDKLAATLAEGIGAGEGISKLTNRVEEVYSEFPTYRAETIARTEATAANNRGFIESYQQSNVANAKEWIATNDGRTRDSHAAADGEIVGLENSFSNGLSYPGDPAGDPAETVNCRCVLAPAFSE